ncbi:MAG: 50S ribosomal protein L4 [Firmicutes bacterium]|nr:50S ribosomal protein L4 [Bacillota bacterium]
MPKVAVYDMQGSTVGELELNDEIFAAPVNEGLMHQAVVMYLANQRRGTAATKTRGAVRGGGRKPWRQKGTGRARHGSIRSPIWVGGGVAFGPEPRDYGFTMPKKARRQALRSALSSKVAAGNVIILDELQLDEPKTRKMVDVLRNLQVAGKALIVTCDDGRNVVLSARNIPGVVTTRARDLNVYTVLNNEQLVITKQALQAIEEVLA